MAEFALSSVEFVGSWLDLVERETRIEFWADGLGLAGDNCSPVQKARPMGRALTRLRVPVIAAVGRPVVPGPLS